MISSCSDPESRESNFLLSQNNDDIKYYSMNYSPLIFINGNMFRGNFRNIANLIESFCNSFEELPD